MAYSIVITYEAVPTAPERMAAPISAIFVPTNAACDMDVFEDTYYDTNVYGTDYGTDLEDFFAMQVSHPGLVAAMRKAAVEGTYTYVTEDPAMELMVDGMKATFKGTGFTFEWQGEAAGTTGETGE